MRWRRKSTCSTHQYTHTHLSCIMDTNNFFIFFFFVISHLLFIRLNAFDISSPLAPAWVLVRFETLFFLSIFFYVRETVQDGIDWKKYARVTRVDTRWKSTRNLMEVHWWEFSEVSGFRCSITQKSQTTNAFSNVCFPARGILSRL